MGTKLKYDRNIRKHSRQDSERPNTPTRNRLQEPQAKKGWNQRIISWKRLWCQLYLWKRVGKKGKNVTCPLKGCVKVGHKTFTSNNWSWRLYQKKFPKKHFFPWLVFSFNIFQTSKPIQMSPMEGFPLLSLRKPLYWWMDIFEELKWGDTHLGLQFIIRCYPPLRFFC